MSSQSVLTEREPPKVGDLVDIDMEETIGGPLFLNGVLFGDPTRHLARVIHVHHRRGEFIAQRLVDRNMVGRLLVFDTAKSSWKPAEVLDRLVHDV